MSNPINLPGWEMDEWQVWTFYQTDPNVDGVRWLMHVARDGVGKRVRKL